MCLKGVALVAEGEQLAVDYIIEQYESAGLQAMGDSRFVQAFPINEGKKWVKQCIFKSESINRWILVLIFLPCLLDSEWCNLQLKSTLALEEAGQVWFKDVARSIRRTIKAIPHFDLQDWI